jgi:hypothetical protein
MDTAKFLKQQIDKLAINPDCTFVAVYGIRAVDIGSEVDVFSNLDDNTQSVMIIATTSGQIAAMKLGIGDGNVVELPTDTTH